MTRTSKRTADRATAQEAQEFIEILDGLRDERLNPLFDAELCARRDRIVPPLGAIYCGCSRCEQ